VRRGRIVWEDKATEDKHEIRELKTQGVRIWVGLNRVKIGCSDGLFCKCSGSVRRATYYLSYSQLIKNSASQSELLSKAFSVFVIRP
jgi:hypothetical protein